MCEDNQCYRYGSSSRSFDNHPVQLGNNFPSSIFGHNDSPIRLHMPEEAILGGLVYMRLMYPFERNLKRFKDYVRNAAKPKVQSMRARFSTKLFRFARGISAIWKQG